MSICTKIRGLIEIHNKSIRYVSLKMGYNKDTLSSMLGQNVNLQINTIESILKALDMELILCAKDTQTGEVYTLCGEYPNGIDVEPYEKRAKGPTWKNLLEKE